VQDADPLPGPSSPRVGDAWPLTKTGVVPSGATPSKVGVIASSVIEEAEILHASLRAGSVAQIVVAIIAIVGFLYLLKFVMVTILLALLLAFILEPLAHQLTRISLPRPAAALIRLLGQLKKRRRAGYVPAGAFVNAYLGLGDNDEAFAWFERAYEEQSNILIYIKVSPLFDPLRGDPRFQDLVRRVGLG
jgi:hypothetical protein